MSWRTGDVRNVYTPTLSSLQSVAWQGTESRQHSWAAVRKESVVPSHSGMAPTTVLTMLLQQRLPTAKANGWLLGQGVPGFPVNESCNVYCTIESYV